MGERRKRTGVRRLVLVVEAHHLRCRGVLGKLHQEGMFLARHGTHQEAQTFTRVTPCCRSRACRWRSLQPGLAPMLTSGGKWCKLEVGHLLDRSGRWAALDGSAAIKAHLAKIAGPGRRTRSPAGKRAKPRGGGAGMTPGPVPASLLMTARTGLAALRRGAPVASSSPRRRETWRERTQCQMTSPAMTAKDNPYAARTNDVCGVSNDMGVPQARPALLTWAISIWRTRRARTSLRMAERWSARKIRV